MKLIISSVFTLQLIINSVLLSQSGWYQQTSGTNSNLNNCFFINDNTGFIAGMDGKLLKTTNGGLYWFNSFNQQNYDITSLYFLNNIGWAVIHDNSENDSLFVLKTINYGVTWNKYNLDSLRGLSWVNSIQFINNNTGYITACNKLYKSTNGGITWFNPSNLYFGIGAHFINDLTGWVCKSPYGIYKTTNGGFNWISQEYFWYHQYVTDILFINSQKGFVLSLGYGQLGPMFYTENSGINWVMQRDNYYGNKSIHFVNINTGYILSGDWYTYVTSKIAKTTNGGLNWELYNINSSSSFNKVFFSSVNTGWVVGDSGVIMKTITGGIPIGIQQTGTKVPVDYSLLQNYPNPFNPVTYINFEIPKASFVKIIIYDALGKEVKVLVDEQLSPGTYNADWDASNYPSGVYYYKLAAGYFTDTKKMMLIK